MYVKLHFFFLQEPTDIDLEMTVEDVKGVGAIEEAVGTIKEETGDREVTEEEVRGTVTKGAVLGTGIKEAVTELEDLGEEIKVTEAGVGRGIKAVTVEAVGLGIWIKAVITVEVEALGIRIRAVRTAEVRGT